MCISKENAYSRRDRDSVATHEVPTRIMLPLICDGICRIFGSLTVEIIGYFIL
jgi:hypothetical protein